jgi:hypothetical protein
VRMEGSGQLKQSMTLQFISPSLKVSHQERKLLALYGTRELVDEFRKSRLTGRIVCHLGVRGFEGDKHEYYLLERNAMQSGRRVYTFVNF